MMEAVDISKYVKSKNQGALWSCLESCQKELKAENVELKEGDSGNYYKDLGKMRHLSFSSLQFSPFLMILKKLLMDHLIS